MILAHSFAPRRTPRPRPIASSSPLGRRREIRRAPIPTRPEDRREERRCLTGYVPRRPDSHRCSAGVAGVGQAVGCGAFAMPDPFGRLVAVKAAYTCRHINGRTVAEGGYAVWWS